MQPKKIDDAIKQIIKKINPHVDSQTKILIARELKKYSINASYDGLIRIISNMPIGAFIESGDIHDQITKSLAFDDLINNILYHGFGKSNVVKDLFGL
jgi:hypothetical protein